MSGHTPGPWIFDPSNTGREFTYGYGIVTERCGYSLAHIPLAERDGGDPDANARLIAAAPELLEALKLAHDHLSVVGTYEDSEELAQIRAALAKAEGR